MIRLVRMYIAFSLDLRRKFVYCVEPLAIAVNFMTIDILINHTRNRMGIISVPSYDSHE